MTNTQCGKKKMTPKLSDELEYIYNILSEKRLVGMDQNPKGVFDLLWGTVRKAEALEKENEALKGE